MRRSWLLVLAAACGGERPNVAPIEVAVPPAPRAAVPPFRDLQIDSEGMTTIIDDAPKFRTKATTVAAGGSLSVDPRDLAATRGDVKVDLVSFRSQSFPDAQTNEALAEHARTWFEAVVSEKVDETQRWAIFRILAIEDLDPSRDALTIPPATIGDLVTRTVTLRARGELILHNRMLPNEAKLRAELAWPKSADRGPPSSIAIRSVEPMKIVLADYAIVPRDSFGKEAKSAFHLLGTKIGPIAEVSVDLTAR